MVERLTLQEFYDLLERHDWHYEMSDDHSVWERGREAEAKLEAACLISPAHNKLYSAYTTWRFGPDRKPENKPKRPE